MKSQNWMTTQLPCGKRTAYALLPGILKHSHFSLTVKRIWRDTKNWTDLVVTTEHHSKKTGEQNLDTWKRGVHRHGALTSSSSHAPACHHTASCPALLVLLVVAFFGASVSPSRCASVRRLAFVIHHTSTFRCAPLIQLVVTLPGALTPPSHQDSARCHLSSHPSCLVGLLLCPAPRPIIRIVVILPLVTASCVSVLIPVCAQLHYV